MNRLLEHPALRSNVSCPFGDLLIHKGLITQDELQQALDDQRVRGGRLGEVLVRLHILDDDTLRQALAEHLSIDCVKLGDRARIDVRAARDLPEAIARRFCLVVLQEEDDCLVTAMADPLDVLAMDTVTLKMQRPIKPVISGVGEIQKAIEYVYHVSEVEERPDRRVEIAQRKGDDTEDGIRTPDVCEGRERVCRE